MTANEKYVELQLEIINQLDTLRNMVENPELGVCGINWCDVGDLAYLKEALRPLISREEV